METPENIFVIIFATRCYA